MTTYRIENKHLLPVPWYDYHVLQSGEYEIIHLLRKENKMMGSIIRVGVQDGVWTLGYSFCGNCCNPGRKWGEYRSREEAIRQFCTDRIPYLKKRIESNDLPYLMTVAELNEMIKTMEVFLNPQLSLF
jgi:hypothetical protein